MPSANAQASVDYFTDGLDEPRGDEAERQTLGACLRWNAVIPEVAAILRREDFRVDAHQKIWDAILWLHENGKPIEAESVAIRLHDGQLIADIGGHRYLAELATSTGSDGPYYAKLVREQSILRALARTAEEIKVDAEAGNGEATDQLEAAEQKIFAISRLGATCAAVPIKTAVAETLAVLDARMRGQSPGGVLTGLKELDDLTAGLRASESIIVGARTSVGKTTLALNVVRHAVTQTEARVLLVSLEQSRTELVERMMCALGHVDSHRLRHGWMNSTEQQAILGASRILDETRLWIDDSGNQTILRVCGNARRMAARHGLDLVVIDYLQLIEPENSKAPRHEQVSLMSRRLKLLARELKIPVMTLVQVSRAAENRPGERPRLSDLRESGAIEQDADTVLLLWRANVEQQNPDIDLIICDVAKQRNGRRGEITLAFRKPFLRFENYSPEAWDKQ